MRILFIGSVAFSAHALHKLTALRAKINEAFILK